MIFQSNIYIISLNHIALDDFYFARKVILLGNLSLKIRTAPLVSLIYIIFFLVILLFIYNQFIIN